MAIVFVTEHFQWGAIISRGKNLSNTTYSVINVLGQVLDKGNLNDTRAINIDQFKSGVYILQLENEYTKVNKRFIIE